MAREEALMENIAGTDKSELHPDLVSIMKEEVGKARQNRIPIIRAFDEIARRSGLKANTIRNYYYRYLHVSDEKEHVSTENSVPLQAGEEAIGRPFTEEETRAMMREMLISQARGESVRSCANRLGNGSKRMLIRYQNKYRSIIARKPEYVEDVIRELEAEGIPCYNPYTRKKASKAGKNKNISAGKMADAQPALSGGEQLVDWISEFVSNINSIPLSSIQDFFKGLRDLSVLAAGNRSYIKRMEKYEQQVEKLNNQVLLMEAGLNKNRSDNQLLGSKLNELTEINQRFLNLSDAEKLSTLTEYLSELESCLNRQAAD
ncbi:MAG: hypothetical protein ACOX22_06050 [Caldicoprobacterales bacterium]|jgi:hypothetical protein